MVPSYCSMILIIINEVSYGTATAASRDKARNCADCCCNGYNMIPTNSANVLSLSLLSLGRTNKGVDR